MDDLLYNVVHDLLIKVHRDEKMARANSAAIRVESLASQNSDVVLDSSKPDVRVETDAAIYEDGRVLLKGNPLKTTKEIVCQRCKLPRLLYPTEGKGAQKPDPNTEYCKKHPYIEKPGYDIYGQTWVAPGPGRGKKKKDIKMDPDTPGTPMADGTSAKDRPPNVLSFPSATCSKCKRCILVTRLNNHMGSCIGNSGRNASRAAAQKISNGSGGSQKDDNTPPGSQKGTPMPTSRAASPRKRDGDEYDEDVDESDVTNPKKKKLKAASAAAAGLGKKVILKTKGPKKEKVKGNSQLSMEQKAEDIGDKNSPVVKNASLEVPPKKAHAKSLSPAKKLKMNSKPPLSSPAAKNGNGGEHEPGSESSGTLSSPPQ